MTDEELARAARDHYKANPEATVTEVAESVGAPEDDVVRIVDEWQVKETGGVEHVGPGGGGGWVTV